MKKKVEKNLGEFEAVCEDYSYDGKGVTHYQGKVVFVNGFFLNEKAIIRLTYERSEFYIGKIVKLLTKSPSRIEPKCKVCTTCGGCAFQQLDYVAQLDFKTHKVEEAFRKIGNMKVKVLPCLGMENPYYYRNKIQMPVGLSQTGRIITGFYKEKTHEIVPIETCYIENEKAEEVLKTIRELMKKFKILPYDEDTRKGIIRHILIRTSKEKKQLMVVLVTAQDVFGGRGEFIKALHLACPSITTIVQNINTRDTNVILGEKERILFGKGYIEDALCGVWFQISSKSFYQVNPVQTEVLYQTAIQFAGLSKKEVVLDCYCGIGTIGLIAARHAKQVIGIEIVKEAISDAKKNAIRNNIQNETFYVGDASEWIVNYVKNKGKVDVLFMDPPRKGSDEKFLSSVLTLKPRKVVYVSCDPSTLARDVKYLSSHYQIEKIQPVDMFPMTYHVETIVLLSRKNSGK